MSPSLDVEFLGREMCGADVITARFSRPPGFAFTAGQWIVLALAKEGIRLAETFTISSAPGDDYLEITTRLSGSVYKNTLVGLTRGDSAAVTGPGGSLTLPRESARVAFLVGGVGITPVRSMLRDAYTTGRTFEDALLLYGNRDVTCVPFEAEFMAMVDRGVRTVVCYEHPPAEWAGESGFITAETVRRHLGTGETIRPFIVAGPPPMVEAMERVLDDLGVQQSNRLIERFGPRSPSGRDAG
jgi:ferredoxin-NADP reductase